MGKMSPFELAWSLLKDVSMLGSEPWKDVREQALLDASREQHTDEGWKESGRQRPGLATIAGGVPPLTSDNSEPEDLPYQGMTQEEADEFNRQMALQAQAQDRLVPKATNLSPIVWPNNPPQSSGRLRLATGSIPQQGMPDYPFVGVKPRINETNPFA